MTCLRREIPLSEVGSLFAGIGPLGGGRALVECVTFRGPFFQGVHRGEEGLGLQD